MYVHGPEQEKGTKPPSLMMQTGHRTGSEIMPPIPFIDNASLFRQTKRQDWVFPGRAFPFPLKLLGPKAAKGTKTKRN